MLDGAKNYREFGLTALELQEYIGRELDTFVNRFIVDNGWCLLWNDKVRQQMVESVAKDIRENY